MLHSTDPNGYATSQLTYTVTSLPTNGTLYLNGVAQTVTGATFTEAQLDTGTYVSFTAGSATASSLVWLQRGRPGQRCRHGLLRDRGWHPAGAGNELPLDPGPGNEAPRSRPAI